jgi:SAM-dependent methyltransferase
MVFDRRRERLVGAIDAMLPQDTTVLDIGCGNGQIGAALARDRQRVVGVETHRRSSCAIPLAVYDGTALPFAADTFDWTVIVDVLHHAPNPTAVIAEALRVSTGGVIIKDHYARTRREHLTLAFMDWVGNRQFGVGRDGAYLSPAEWAAIFDEHALDVTAREDSMGLYPAVAGIVFERGLHFVARLEPRLNSA